MQIDQKEYGIRELKFANCGLTGRGLGIIIREGLLANMDVSSFVETIDFSNNKFFLLFFILLFSVLKLILKK